MKKLPKQLLILVTTMITLFSLTACNNREETPAPLAGPPSQVYGSLYSVVQNSNIFSDSKTFADAIPKESPKKILAKWAKIDLRNPAEIKNFVYANFILPTENDSNNNLSNNQSILDYTRKMWDQLARNPEPQKANDTLIALPEKYIVPGGRFREIYYWDSYYSMLGLSLDNKWDLVKSMVDDFDFLIKKYGHIPNGNRVYYLSRSQPPYFSMMVQLLAEHEGNVVYQTYQESLLKEYDYWMKRDQNSSQLDQNRTVKMPDGSILNRYWDDLNTPRDEARKEDEKTAILAEKTLGRNKPQVYRDIRAAASGWDFSSRWFANPRNMATIKTTSIVPIDLNTLLYNLEKVIEKSYEVKNDLNNTQKYNWLAARRKQSIQKYLLNGGIL